MKKRIGSLLLAVFTLVGMMNGMVFAKENISSKYVDSNKAISIELPKVKGLKSSIFEAKINNMMRSKADKDLENFIEEAGYKKYDSELKIDYEVKSDGDILSIIVTTYSIISGDANGETRKDYYNIDTKNNKILKLKDMFPDNENYKEDVNKEIKRVIDNNLGKYYTGSNGFKSIKDDQNFYVDKSGNVVVTFNQYEIGPRSTGIPEFTIRQGKDLVYSNEELGIDFRLPPIWDGVVFMGFGDQFIDFIYDTNDSSLESKKILSIKAVKKADYKENEKDMVLGENDKYKFLADLSLENPYKDNKSESERFTKVIEALDGLDDLIIIRK